MSPAQDDAAAAAVVAALRTARTQFISEFAGKLKILTVAVAALGHGDTTPLADAARVAHRLAGIAATVGFPETGNKAVAIEQALRAAQGTGHAGVVADLLEEIAALYTNELTAPTPEWQPAMAGARAKAGVLVVEDDPLQGQLLAALLGSHGYQVTGLDAGERIVAVAVETTPQLVVLDIDLPGIDGFEVCRRLKDDPATAHIPVMFLTAKADALHRATGLALDADDYLVKPFDPTDVLLRVRHILTQAPPAAVPAPAESRPTSVLIADDDPLVRQIVEARLRAANFAVTIAEDGREAFDTLSRGTPDLLLLDMTMPKMTGFDVLTRMRAAGGPRPKVLVLSARGREADIVRAFDLGADDYVTKPFSPDELFARVTRLLRK